MNNEKIIVFRMMREDILPEDVNKYIEAAKIITNAGISIASASNVTPFYAMDMILHAIKTFKEEKVK